MIKVTKSTDFALRMFYQFLAKGEAPPQARKTDEHGWNDLLEQVKGAQLSLLTWGVFCREDYKEVFLTTSTGVWINLKIAKENREWIFTSLQWRKGPGIIAWPLS